MTTTDDDPDTSGQSSTRSSDAYFLAEELSEKGHEDDRLDKLFMALANATRRAIVNELQAIDRPVSLADLARDLAEASGGLGDSNAERLYIELYHRHIPALTEVDGVEFNGAQRTVDKGEGFQTLARLLMTVHRTGDGQ